MNITRRNFGQRIAAAIGAAFIAKPAAKAEAAILSVTKPTNLLRWDGWDVMVSPYSDRRVEWVRDRNGAIIAMVTFEQ